MDALISKTKQIKLLILDVDGVLTNGLIYYDDNGNTSRAFHIHDGIGMQLLMKSGVEIAIISGKHSHAVKKRLAELSIKHIYLGKNDKRSSYNDIRDKLKLTNEQIAYMGDDLPDLPLMQQVGLAITVPQAPDIIKQASDIITQKKAGKGAVREACEFILNAQGTLSEMIQLYLSPHTSDESHAL